MMQHERCSRYGCQLALSMQALGRELPIFKLGDLVGTSFETEFGEQEYYRGQVIGCHLAYGSDCAGWWYIIRWISALISTEMNLPIVESAHESELELISIDMG